MIPSALVDAALLAVRPDPLRGIDRALLERRVDVAGGDLLGDDTHLLQDSAGEAADPELEALQIRCRRDLFGNQPPIRQLVLPPGSGSP